MDFKLNKICKTKFRFYTFNWLKHKIPADCLVCGDFSLKNLDLCSICHAKIVENNNCCSICAEPFTIEINAKPICGACVQKRPDFEILHSPFLYQPPLEDILWKFKFKADLACGNLLVDLIVQKYPNAFAENALLISMPKNPAHDYALNLDAMYSFVVKMARKWDVDYLSDKFIKRKTGIAAQRGLTLKQRQRNMRKAWIFADDIGSKIEGRNLILIDDVATTASSLNFLAKELKKYKPLSIKALSILRTPK